MKRRFDKMSNKISRSTNYKWKIKLEVLLFTRWGYPCLASVSPSPPLPLTHTNTYKFKRFGVSAYPDKKFPVEAVPSLATRQL
jgi:hypothetical protein